VRSERYGTEEHEGEKEKVKSSGLLAMNTIFNNVCVLVTAAFALTLVPGFRKPARSLQSRQDQRTALVVFMSLGLLEEATAIHAGWLSQRIVAVCAGGLVVGPWANDDMAVRLRIAAIETRNGRF
jgi:LytS/YehU family sensor histidine kinase